MTEVRYIQKEEKTVNNQYRFVSHDAVTAATSEAFIKHGVYAKPRIIKSEITTINVEKYNKHDKTTKNELSFVCNVEVEYDFINVDDPKDKICGINGLGQGIDSQDKACGKAISYACKYALLKALGIETGDDPEKDVDYNISKKLEKTSEEIFAGLKAMFESCGGNEEIEELLQSKKTDILKLKKYESNLYEMLGKTITTMRESFNK